MQNFIEHTGDQFRALAERLERIRNWPRNLLRNFSEIIHARPMSNASEPGMFVSGPSGSERSAID